MENAQKERPTTSKATPEEGGRLDRIADQTKGLVDDIKDWIDLKVQLVQLDLEDRFETIANNVLGTLLVVVLAFITLIFGLIAASLALGRLFGDPLWGFLAVTVLLIAATGLTHALRPRFVRANWSDRKSDEGVQTDARSLEEAKAPPRLPEAKSTPTNQHQHGAGSEKNET